MGFVRSLPVAVLQPRIPVQREDGVGKRRAIDLAQVANSTVYIHKRASPSD